MAKLRQDVSEHCVAAARGCSRGLDRAVEGVCIRLGWAWREGLSQYRRCCCLIEWDASKFGHLISREGHRCKNWICSCSRCRAYTERLREGGGGG